MPQVYAAADLVVERAGASTIAELTAIGVPSVLVPWSDAAADHQTRNARWLGDAGGAIVVTEERFDGSVLADEISRLIVASGALTSMADAARRLGAVHRSSALVDLIESVAR
jgi:UDP-N-acetylglucosamine--N-acetylmuramyl-(pentapeptide) pyrophosphoryl-undecaprenol N-acetylglucosamine transferase